MSDKTYANIYRFDDAYQTFAIYINGELKRTNDDVIYILGELSRQSMKHELRISFFDEVNCDLYLDAEDVVRSIVNPPDVECVGLSEAAGVHIDPAKDVDFTPDLIAALMHALDKRRIKNNEQKNT